MMMKLFLFTTVSLLLLGSANAASDTTNAPTPAEVIAPAINSTADVVAVLENNAVNSKLIRLNPRAKSFVEDYMRQHRKSMMAMKDWGLPYFNMIDKIFVQYDLPVELKYLAVIESKLKSSAVSRVGAVGPWQFMPATARQYGLKITSTKDERRDYVKSTHAAAKYLKVLYNEFGDWLLAIAAYNGGPGYVLSAIRKSGSHNFWILQNYLPEESRNHVKKFISAHYLFEGQGSICTLTKSEATEQIAALAGYLQKRSLTAEELNESSTTTISGKYRAEVIAKYVNMDSEEFNRYNPYFDQVMDQPENKYDLKLPAENMEKFIANKYPILNESVQLLLTTSDLKEEQDSDLNNKQQTTAIK
jgi:membrane-bound lytic murein transglycosylase D